MSQKKQITRIRVLYTVFIVVLAAFFALFIFSFVTMADPIGFSIPAGQDDGYSLLITDLESSPAVCQRTDEVEGLVEGLSAKVSVGRFDVLFSAVDKGMVSSGRVHWCMWLQVGSVVISLAMMVLVVMTIVSLYINVRRGKLFPPRTMSWITWIGALMIVVSLMLDFSHYLEHTLAAELLGGSNWQPMPVVELHMGRLFFGLTLIFMAEIFKIGRDMQEEQELTI